jgi:hypothetical protein
LAGLLKPDDDHAYEQLRRDTAHCQRINRLRHFGEFSDQTAQGHFDGEPDERRVSINLCLDWSAVLKVAGYQSKAREKSLRTRPNEIKISPNSCR